MEIVEIAEAQFQAEGAVSEMTTAEDSAAGMIRMLQLVDANSIAPTTSFEALANMYDFGLESEDTKPSTIEKIWEGIKRIFYRVFDMASNFISRLFGGLAKTDALLKEQLAALHKVPNLVKVIETHSAHNLIYRGALDRHHISLGMTELNDLIKRIYDHVNTIAAVTETTTKEAVKTEGTVSNLSKIQQSNGGIIEHTNLLGGYVINAFRNSDVGGLPVIKIARKDVQPTANISTDANTLKELITKALSLSALLEKQGDIIKRSEARFREVFKIVDGALGLSNHSGFIKGNVGKYLIGSKLRKEFGLTNVLLMKTSSIAYAAIRTISSITAKYLD